VSKSNYDKVHLAHANLDARGHNVAVSALYVSFLLVVSACLDLFYTIRSTTNIVYADTWAFVPILGKTLSGHFSIGMLWAPHNENRQPILRSIFLISATFDHFNTMHIREFGIFVLLIEEAIFLVLAMCLSSRYLRIFVGLAIAALCSSLVQWESMILEENWMFFLTVAAATLSFIFLELGLQGRNFPKRPSMTWAAVALFATLSSLSLAGGLAVWFVLALRVLTFKWDQRNRIAAGVIVLVGVLEGATYAWNMPGGGLGTRQLLHVPIWESFRFYLLCVSGSLYNVGLSSGRVIAGYIIGIFLIIAIGAIVVRAWSSETIRRDPLFGIGLCLVAFGALQSAFIEYGRIGMGMSLAFGSRYTTLTQTVPIGVLICGARIYEFHAVKKERSVKNPRRIVATVGLGLVFLLAVVGSSLNNLSQLENIRNNRSYFSMLEQEMLSKEPLTDAQLNAFLWSPPQIRSGLEVLRKYNLSVYR
jgi:hypothetical protein